MIPPRRELPQVSYFWRLGSDVPEPPGGAGAWNVCLFCLFLGGRGRSRIISITIVLASITIIITIIRFTIDTSIAIAMMMTIVTINVVTIMFIATASLLFPTIGNRPRHLERNSAWLQPMLPQRQQPASATRAAELLIRQNTNAARQLRCEANAQQRYMCLQTFFLPVSLPIYYDYYDGVSEITTE